MMVVPLAAWQPTLESFRPWFRHAAVVGLVLALSSAQAAPVTFYAISSISSSTAATDGTSASFLIEGAGVGFSASAPYNRLSTNTWYTRACSFPCDYFASLPAPVLTLDLGQNRLLSEISLWGYGHPNSASSFSLQFATQAEGTGAFASSIAYSPTFTPAQQATTMQEFVFTQNVTARYVRMTITDNFYTPATSGSGGDRVGLSEIAFETTVPEPGSLALAGAALCAAGAFRRRSRRS